MEYRFTDDNFAKEVQASSQPVLVDFYADWCGPCKMMAPVMDSLSEDYDDVKFVKVNVDNNPDLAAKFGVQSIPNFVFIKDGHKVDQVVGARDSESFEGIIERNK